MSAKDLLFVLLGEDRSASRTMTEAASNAEKSTARIGGAFSKVGGVIGGEFGSVLDRVGSGISQVGEKTGKLSSSLIVGGGVVSGMGVALNMMGSGHKQAADQLEQAVKNSGKSFEDYRGQFDKAILKQQGFGRSAIDTQEALRKLTQSTNDPKKALAEMGVVSDLAAAKNISLSEAADIMSKVLIGKGGRALSQFGIIMGSSKDKTKDVETAVDALSKKVDGQASKSVDNFGAQVNVAKTRLTDWGASMGEKVGPVLTALGPTLMIVGVAMDLFRAKQVATAAATLAGTAVVEGSSIATKAAAAGQWLLNVAMSANPIGIIIVAIAALVAGLIWFFTQTKLGKEVWHNMVTGIGVAWNWLWNSVIKPVGDFIVFSFKTIGSIAGTVFSTIGSIISGVFGAAVSIARNNINIMIDLINGIIGNINGIGSAIKTATGGAIDIRIGKIPRLATGGVTNGPMLAVIGDNPGGREIVQPLSMYKADLAKERAAGAQTSQGKAAQGGFYIDKFITQAGQSPQEIAANLGWLGRWAT